MFPFELNLRNIMPKTYRSAFTKFGVAPIRLETSGNVAMDE